MTSLRGNAIDEKLLVLDEQASQAGLSQDQLQWLFALLWVTRASLHTIAAAYEMNDAAGVVLKIREASQAIDFDPDNADSFPRWVLEALADGTDEQSMEEARHLVTRKRRS